MPLKSEDQQRQMEIDMRRGGPRAERAQRFANQTVVMLRDFLPPGRECRRLIWDQLVELAYEQNLQIINVPPEWDELDKLAIERAMMDRKMTTIAGPNQPLGFEVAQAIAGATSLVRDVSRT